MKKNSILNFFSGFLSGMVFFFWGDWISADLGDWVIAATSTLSFGSHNMFIYAIVVLVVIAPIIALFDCLIYFALRARDSVLEIVGFNILGFGIFYLIYLFLYQLLC